MNIKQLDEALYDKYIAPTDRPVPNERYRMLYHYLHSYHRYENTINMHFHDRPDFGTFTSAS